MLVLITILVCCTLGLPAPRAGVNSSGGEKKHRHEQTADKSDKHGTSKEKKDKHGESKDKKDKKDKHGESKDGKKQEHDATEADKHAVDSVDDADEGQRKEETDLEALRRAAEAEAAKEQEPEKDIEDKTFKSGNLGLQALNPEISATGDMLASYQSGIESAPTTRTVFRNLGLHFQAYLDPYSRFKAAIPITSFGGAELGEAYFTRFGLLGSTNITLGKFRQQFGIVNRWHMHALDWFNFPLALTSVFGPEGLNQVGMSLDGAGSTGPIVHGYTVQVTDATNQQMFGGNSENRPSILGRYSAYQDLSPSTYLQISLTGLVGWNDAWTTVDTSFHSNRTTAVYGADLVVMWEPTGNMRYRNIEWRSEGYYVDKGIYAPDGSGADWINPWGFYSLIQTKVSRTLEIGARYDYFAPDTKAYASVNPELALFPIAVTQSDPYRQLVGAWFTWWQSPFVKFRGGYSFENSTGVDSDIHFVTLQMVFAAGPHKHDRY